VKECDGLKTNSKIQVMRQSLVFSSLNENELAELAGLAEEVYLGDPGKTTPEDLLTETRFPVKKR